MKALTEAIVESQAVIDYLPFPKQELFHINPARYRLFGGAAGPGKSLALVEEAVAQCLENDFAVDGVLFRRTFPELEMSLIKTFLAKIPASLYEYNQAKHVATFKRNGSTLRFAHCRNEADVYTFQSAEFDFIGIDELTHWTQFQYAYLMSRLRTVKKGIYSNFFGGTNPGNIGHVWVRDLFVLKKTIPPLEKAEDYAYIHATVDDNPVLMKNDPAYVARLDALPPTQKRALRYGDWNIFQGQFFSEFLEAVHVVDPFLPPASWKRFRAIDYGSSAPFCCLWFAQNPQPDIAPFDAAGQERLDLKGIRLIIYKEYYYPYPDLMTGEILVPLRTDKENFQAVKDLSANEEIDYTVGDPAMWAGKEVGRDIASIAWALGIPMQPANNDRVSGWARVREMLKFKEATPLSPTGTAPFAKITKNCYNLLRTLPAIIHHDKKLEDIADGQEDHAPDTMRYGAKSVAAGIIVKHNQPESPDEDRRGRGRRSIRRRFDPHATVTY